jgi:hypothetical protein
MRKPLFRLTQVLDSDLKEQLRPRSLKHILSHD